MKNALRSIFDREVLLDIEVVAFLSISYLFPMPDYTRFKIEMQGNLIMEEGFRDKGIDELLKQFLRFRKWFVISRSKQSDIFYRSCSKRVW